jgi:hypothetical protein
VNSPASGIAQVHCPSDGAGEPTATRRIRVPSP